jgi:predicted porin
MLESNVRHNITPNWEVFAGLEWQFWDEDSDQKAYNLGAQYKWNSIALGAEYTKYSDSEVFGLYARYQF